MSRFCMRRQWVVGLCVLSVLLSSHWVAPTVSYADTSWMDILKPLVRDVIVPGANAGMKKIIEKKLGKKIDGSSTSNPNLTTDESVMTMPEEPYSANDSSDDMISMPEEPTYTSNASADGSAPPPPVETP